MRKAVKKTRSITKQIVVITVGIIIGVVLLCIALNTTLLGTYYSYKKQNILCQGYKTINEACIEDTLYNNSFDIEFESIAANGNLTISILSPSWSLIRSSASNYSAQTDLIYQIRFGDQSNVDILKESEYYYVERVLDNRLDEQYLVLIGSLYDGNQILMRTPLEGIRESAIIANQFLIIAGIIAVFVSIFVVIIVSKKITNPILELSEISRRMSELDFEAKFCPHHEYENEIDVLGDHMNALSRTLEETISELKSANLEMKRDIEKKDEIEKMRTEFLANVSHELKTPIALISGYAEGLKESIDDDRESRDFYCEVIMDEAKKMNEMVKKLLSLNQLEFGNEMIDMKRFDVTELTGGVISASQILAQQNQITIEFHQDKPIYVWADEFLIEEVLTNYVSNAIHYAKNEKRIIISFTDFGESLRVSVFNTGDNIPAEDIENIWDKFYKVDKARTREYGGNGIGLSIVKAIMQSHDRDFGVINKENGVEFYFELDKKTGDVENA